MKKYRKYLLGLLALVVVTVLGTIGGMALAAGSNAVSNTLTLSGNANLPTDQMTLAWVSVEGGVKTLDAEAVTWIVGTEYTAIMTAKNNNVETISGIYGKITGWDPTKFQIVYPAATLADGDGNLNTDEFCGFWEDGIVGGTYYFGPKATNGDSYPGGVTREFSFEIKPLQAGTISTIQIVDVTDVTDPRP